MKDKLIQFKVTEDIHIAAKELAIEYGLSVTQLVRFWLMQMINKSKTK